MSRYIVFGAGAIGSILGATLYRSGQDTVLIGRGSHVQAIRKEGLQLMSEGVLRRIKVSAIEDLGALKPRPDDILLLTAKSQDTETATRQLSGIYGPRTSIVSLQNAVRNEEILARRFEGVYGGLVVQRKLSQPRVRRAHAQQFGGHRQIPGRRRRGGLKGSRPT
jgi:2-dehydropantoate 2-reductase